MSGAYRLDGWDEKTDGERLVRLCREHIREAAHMEVLSGNPRDVIGCVRMDAAGRRYVFAANQGGQEVRIAVSAGDCSRKKPTLMAQICDLETGVLTPIETDSADGTVIVRLGSFESVWIQLADEAECVDEMEVPVRDSAKILAMIPEEEPALTVPMGGLWNVRINGRQYLPV